MAGYDQIPTVVGELKRAAIDVYMGDQGWTPHFADNDLYALWGFAGINSYRRPAMDGSGGGEPTGDASRLHGSLAPTFDGIRIQVDALVRPWLHLPDGSACRPIREAVGSTAGVFGASGTGGSLANSGGITTSNETIREVVLNQMEGSFTVPFLDKYFTRFSEVAQGIGATCAILEINYAAEAQMWPAARTDAAAICVAARDAFRRRAGQSADAYGTIGLTVVVAVLGAIASVVTAGAAAPAVGVLLGLSTTATAALAGLDANTKLEGDDYAGIMTSFGDALATLNARLVDQETVLVTMLDRAVAVIDADRASFNLDVYAAPPSEQATTLTMSTDAAGHVSVNMLHNIEALNEARDSLGLAPAPSPAIRDSAVGLGPDGTHASAVALYERARECLAFTTWEYERGKALFEATVADYLATDASAGATSDDLAAEMGG